MSERIEQLYRTESRRILATLIRLLGDFDLAEEALQDAFVAAAERWPIDGVPESPRAWLVSTGRFKAVDRLRRRARFDRALEALAANVETEWTPRKDDDVKDDRLRLVFTCCHPALPPDGQVALALREVCGLTTEEIAAAFLVKPSTIAQRIVRAKSLIRSERIPYETPAAADLPGRLEFVLRVVYLVFREGYAAAGGGSLIRVDLSTEAIRLGRVLMALLPDPEVVGLLGLMLLHDSRRRARVSESGDLVLFADQDRALWDQAQIAEGRALAERAMASSEIGPYCLQAAIAAVHASATSEETTDWPTIVRLYDLLVHAEPSPFVELNRATAVAMRDGPAAGLALIDGILARGELRDYHLAHAARGELLRRLGRWDEARAAFAAAVPLARQDAERRFLESKLAALPA